VPPESVGCIIGEQGKSVRRLQDATRCRLRVSNGAWDADDDESRALVGPQGKVRWVSITSCTPADEANVALCSRTVQLIGQRHVARGQSKNLRSIRLADFMASSDGTEHAVQDLVDVALQQALAEREEQTRCEAEQERQRSDAVYSEDLTRRMMMEWSDRFSEASIRQALQEAGLDLDAATELLLNSGLGAIRQPQQKSPPAATKPAEALEEPRLPAPQAAARQLHPLSFAARRAREEATRDEFWAKRKGRSAQVSCQDRAQLAHKQREIARKQKGRAR